MIDDPQVNEIIGFDRHGIIVGRCEWRLNGQWLCVAIPQMSGRVVVGSESASRDWLQDRGAVQFVNQDLKR